jgi:two-component system cell cycle sensor histidine kinase/response regulator CckA
MKPDVVLGLENAAWPVLLVGADGAIRLANGAAKSFFGTALDGQPAQLSSIWSPENGGMAGDFLTLWRQAPKAVVELKFRPAGGAAAVKFITAISHLHEEGATSFLLQLFSTAGIMTPMVDSKPAMETDAAVKHKLECVLQLARTMSLDFNNALTGVLAHTSLLLGKAEPNHPWRLSLLEVEKSAARAAEIAGELALFSRQEKETRRTPVGNLNAVAGRCVEFFRNAHGGRFQWNLTMERALFESRFDEAKVQQALAKVFDNAVESFGASGGGQIAVQIRNVELTEATQDRNVRLAAGTYVCVEVADTGAGIAPEALPKIFEPFFTTKGPPHRGLGLALVYGIITNHGGGVAISSQSGKGTSVRVYVPAEKSRIQELPTASDNGLRGTGTILVVDDESLLLTMAETILSDFGYQVLTANSGQKALQILSRETTKVDLLVTDLVMPGMAGRELIERVRQQDLDFPILCTSGYVVPEDKQAAISYLRKPFTSTELLRRVKAALAGGPS